MKKVYLYIFYCVLLGVLSLILLQIYVLSFSSGSIYKSISQMPNNYVGLVFGASVLGKQSPSDILKDRLDGAFEAYTQGKIRKIIVSGDNSRVDYNEPLAMQKYLLKLGVEYDDIYLDYAGFDTYDSLYRAKKIFGLRELSLFTQEFHLQRALYISNRLGMDAIGLSTDFHIYRARWYNMYREFFARTKAFFEVELLRSKPKFLGDPIMIITDEDIEKTKKSLID